MSGNAAPLTKLSVLGAFAFSVGNRRYDLPLQSRRLVGLLAVHGAPLARGTVAGQLWGECTNRSAHSKLRNALWRVRQAAAGAVISQGEALALHDSVFVDLAAARACAARLHEDPTEWSSDDVELLGSDLLPDWDEDWLTIERERLKQDRMHALERLSQVLRRDRRYVEAIKAALAAISIEPLRESAQMSLIETHLAEGNASEAIRQYRAYRDLLHEQLSIEPSPRLRSLIRVALLDDPHRGSIAPATTRGST